jgi:uncharacterized membrane protein
MQNDDHPHETAEQGGDHHDDSEHLTHRDLIGAISLIVVVAGILAAYYAFNYINKDSVRMQFWVGFMFSFLAFVVLVVQVAIIAQQAEFMKQQRKAMTDSVDRSDTIIERMEDQLTEMKTQNERLYESVTIERAKTDPRLRIAEVTAENFEVGKRPFFVVTIANDGLLAATGVKIAMHIEIGNETPMNWIDDQVVTIPANGREHYFIHSSSWMTQEHLDGFENAVPLRVVGFFEYLPVGTTKVCYKYLALQGDYRPPKIPQFVPCDFNPRLNTSIVPETGHFTLTGYPITMTHGKVVPKGKDDEGNQKNNANGESEGKK